MRTDILPGWHACRQAADGVASVLRDFERVVGTTEGGVGAVAFHQQHPEHTVGRNPLAAFDAGKEQPESYRQRLYENMEDIASAIGRLQLAHHRRNFSDLMMYIGCLRVGDPMG